MLHAGDVPSSGDSSREHRRSYQSRSRSLSTVAAQVYLVSKLQKTQVSVSDVGRIIMALGNQILHCLDVSTRLLFTVLLFVGATSESVSSEESTCHRQGISYNY